MLPTLALLVASSTLPSPASSTPYPLILPLLLLPYPTSSTRYSLAEACGCQCTTRSTKEGVVGGNCKTAYKGRLWCYVEDLSGSVYCKDATKSKNYSGTYWSYDACFTPARTDQLCQLVVGEGRTECQALEEAGRRQVMQCPITGTTALARRIEPRSTMFCSQFSISLSRREEGGRRPVITDQLVTTDSQGVRWYCNKSCFYPGDVAGRALPPTCYFPPLIPASSTSPYDSVAQVEVLDMKTRSSGRDCTWLHRGDLWTCSLP